MEKSEEQRSKCSAVGMGSRGREVEWVGWVAGGKGVCGWWRGYLGGGKLCRSEQLWWVVEMVECNIKGCC